MSSKVKHESPEEAIKELRREFERRLADISSSMEGGDISTADEMIEVMRKEFDRRVAELRGRLDETLEAGKAAVQERPLLFIGAALSVGLLIGLLLGRKSKD